MTLSRSQRFTWEAELSRRRILPLDGPDVYQRCDLGDPDRSPSAAMPFDAVGKLVGEPGWRRALPGWLLTALSGCAGLSEYTSRPPYGCRHRRLYLESCPLRPAPPWGT